MSVSMLNPIAGRFLREPHAQVQEGQQREAGEVICVKIWQRRQEAGWYDSSSHNSSPSTCNIQF